MPLSCQGLWLAEMTTPAEKPCLRARKAMAGVVRMPADSTSAPAARRPAVRVAAIQGPDSRVSMPRTMRTGLWASRELGGEGDADCVDGALVEGGFAGDCANSVCSKQLPHADPLRRLISNS